MTVEDLLAIEEIRSLRAEYSAHFDTRNVAALATLFTDDAVCEFGHYGEWRGLEQIRANYAGVIAAIPAPFDTLHVATNGLVRLRSATTAVGRWYLMDLLPTQVPGVFETRGGHASRCSISASTRTTTARSTAAGGSRTSSCTSCGRTRPLPRCATRTWLRRSL